MAFFFQDFFGGMPHGHAHGHSEENESDEDTSQKDKFYTILEVSKNATEEEIKKAYKAKARQLHPDRHPDEREKYQELFQELQQAYEVLVNPEKRQIYDKYGEKGLKRGGGAHEANDIFRQFFGGAPSGRDTGPKKSPPIKQVVDVTLEDLYRGVTKQITVERYTSSKDSTKCSKCDGDGVITQIQRMGPMVVQQRRDCPQCNGMGYQLQSENAKVDVSIPVGGRHGETITVAGEGHKYPDLAQGDILVQLNQLKHPVFRRQGADLGMTYTLSLREALCGYKIKIKHVSGQTLIITPKDKNSVVHPGTLKRVLSYGMPQRFLTHSRGHLYIQMEVEMPKSNSLNENIISEFAKILPNDKNEDESDVKDDKSKDKSKKKNEAKNNKNQNKQEEEEETEQHCETEDVDGNPHATPASAKSAYEEDDDEGQNVSCRQM